MERSHCVLSKCRCDGVAENTPSSPVRLGQKLGAIFSSEVTAHNERDVELDCHRRSAAPLPLGRVLNLKWQFPRRGNVREPWLSECSDLLLQMACVWELLLFEKVLIDLNVHASFHHSRRHMFVAGGNENAIDMFLTPFGHMATFEA